MGRAVVLSNAGDGRYTIEIDLGTGPRAEKVAQITAQIALLNTRINTAILAVAAAQSVADSSQAALEALINALGSGTEVPVPGSPAGREHEQALRVSMLTMSSLARKKSTLAALQMQRTRQQRLLTSLQALPLIQTRSAWCIDLTETASGAVATAEIPGESDLVLIKPGAPAWQPADGVLGARELLDANQAFFNVAILPGWQKYKPNFRRGTITALNFDNNTANVSLAAHQSSAQRLNVDQQSSFVGIPVRYMTCNAQAFEVGDQVVVMFDDQDQSQPHVIGFVTDPRPCEQFTITYIFSLDRFPETQEIYRGRDGDPVSATAPFGMHAWMGWSDGNTSLSRQATDVVASATYTAQYTSFPFRRARIDFFEFYTISAFWNGSDWIVSAGIRGRYRFFNSTGFATDTTSTIADLSFDVIGYTGHAMPFAPVAQADYVSGPYQFSFPTINSLATSVVGTKVILGQTCSVTYDLTGTSGQPLTSSQVGDFTPTAITPLYLV